MKHEESKLQISCVKWFRLAYPKLILIGIPNGGQRNKITASILKAEGTISGVPDIFLAYPNRIHGGMWIEMKTEKGKIQPSQKEMMEKLLFAGYHCVVCRNFDEFKIETEKYINNGHN